jgi:hypothetical protein
MGKKRKAGRKTKELIKQVSREFGFKDKRDLYEYLEMADLTLMIEYLRRRTLDPDYIV